MILRFGLQAAERAWWQFIRWISPSRTLQGIRVTVFVDDPAHCFDRIGEGLDLLARYDPDTLDRLRALFRGILVFGKEPFHRAYWNGNSRLCVLTESYVQSSAPSESIACTLVHEATHARLDKAGVRYREGRRAAIEVLCAMAELAFARRITHDPTLAKQKEERIDQWSTAGESMWSDRTKDEAKFDYLKELGTPQWIVVAVDRLARFLRSRAA